MDIKKRQEAPGDLKKQSFQTKLKRRAAYLSKYLWSKRNPTNPLKDITCVYVKEGGKSIQKVLGVWVHYPFKS